MSKFSKLSERLRDFIHPFVLFLSKTRVKFRMICDDGDTKLIPGKPVIFAFNHGTSFDIPIASRAISDIFKRRCEILVGTQNLQISDRLFFFLHGTVWVDRKSKTNMALCKEKLIICLKNNQDILWFPEGTWNITENLPILPMKWGIIDVAAKAGAQIVPAAMEYDRDTMICNISFGIPLQPDENTDKEKAICNLRDTMATLRWQQWEKHKSLQQDEIDRYTLKKEMFIPLEEYPPLDWDYESSIIFQPFEPSKKAFAHLNDLIPCVKNAFLFNKRLN